MPLFKQSSFVMAQIKKLADGKYLIRASKGTGKNRVYDNATFYGTLAESRDEARDMEIMLTRGKLARVRFEKCFRAWLKAITPKLAPRTVDGYEGSITRYALESLKDKKLGKIERQDIQSVYDACRLSSTTVRNCHSALNAFFSWTVKRGDIKENPCKYTDRPAKTRKEIVVMTNEEAARFNDVCRTMPNGVIFQFALETAMRPEEVLAVRWGDIRGHDVSVAQAVQFKRKGGGYDFRDIKTPHGRRRIPISETLRLRLVQHRREQNEHRLAMKSTWFQHDLVFPNEIGRPHSINNITRRYLTPIRDKCGFEKHITLYALRHTCATLLLMGNMNVKIVSARLGHASVVLTLDTYGHVLPHIQDEATDMMESIMRGQR